MFPGVLDSREARPSRGSSSQSSPGLSPRISQRDLEVQNLQEQLAANQANTSALVAHMMQLQQAFTVRKHNGKHPFSYTDTYILINTLQLQSFAQ